MVGPGSDDAYGGNYLGNRGSVGTRCRFPFPLIQ